MSRNAKAFISQRATKASAAITSSDGQTKVTEYFPTVHRDAAKKRGKRVTSLTDEAFQSIEKSAPPFASPTKLTRLKSPQISPETQEKADAMKWVLPPLTAAERIALEKDLDPCAKLKEEKISSLSEQDSFSGLPEMKKGDATEPQSAQKVPTLPSISREPSRATKFVEAVKKSVGILPHKISDNLPLPAKYKHLLDLFDATEVVVSWLQSQGKRITLDEVIMNVRRKVKCSYNKDQFAQIIHVYPESYKVRVERCWAPIGGTSEKSNDFEFVIEPNLKDGAPPLPEANAKETYITTSVNLKSSSPVKSDLKAVLSSPSKMSIKPSPHSPLKTCNNSPVMSPIASPKKRCSERLESYRFYRKSVFKKRLHKLVIEQHLKFLKGLGIDISPDQKLFRYHPDFELDLVDDIPTTSLPEPPKGDAAEPKTMRDYLKTIPDSSDTLPERIRSVIKELRSPGKEEIIVSGRSIPLSPKKYYEANKDKSKLSLLERIRAKERERKMKDMLRNPAMELKKARLERISRSLLQCICSCYNLNKVRSMRFADLVDKIAFSLRCISLAEVEATILLLNEVCPEYFTMVIIRDEKYLKLKENNFAAIRCLVDKEITKCV